VSYGSKIYPHEIYGEHGHLGTFINSLGQDPLVYDKLTIDEAVMLGQPARVEPSYFSGKDGG
jgi:hypothetical protein